MGVVEKGARKIRKIGAIQQALLATALVGGLVLIGAAPPPSVLLSLAGKRNKHKFKYQAAQALLRLTRQGYITFEERGGKRYARITPAGQQLLELEQRKKALQLEKKKRWDKRWRIVIFDIPEKRRKTRDQLRIIMHDAGFYRLQDSVWLYPHDCEDFIALLKADLKIGLDVLYMVVEKIEHDGKLLEHFHIK